MLRGCEGGAAILCPSLLGKARCGYARGWHPALPSQELSAAGSSVCVNDPNVVGFPHKPQRSGVPSLSTGFLFSIVPVWGEIRFKSVKSASEKKKNTLQIEQRKIPWPCPGASGSFLLSASVPGRGYLILKTTYFFLLVSPV